MKLVIFGLSITSSWGNGHATLWRGLCRALARRGHRIVFFEKDVPYYAEHRDLRELEGVEIALYTHWSDALPLARKHLADADVAMVTSYCAEAIAASELIADEFTGQKVFYDLDTAVTLDRLQAGLPVSYIGPRGLRDFDLVLSYTGGRSLDLLRSLLGAREVWPLYGSVDPEIHVPVPPVERYRCDLSYIGTYAADRQAALETLFLDPARRMPEQRFAIAGSQYPQDFPWQPNIYYFRHLPPSEHPPFYCSSRLTLNVTRKAMAEMGYCPSGRFFEAAACGVPVLSDVWEGLDQFFAPGREILCARTTEEAIAALSLSDAELARIGRSARERTLECHTAEHRAVELEQALERRRRRSVWGIIPAAGVGSRIQPLAFSKELLPVGSRFEQGVERPRAVSEFLVERMLIGGANKICFIISPGKSDIMEYYGGRFCSAHVSYTVQQKPAGLCDAIFRAEPLIHPEDRVLIGLPDTIWFPEDGYRQIAREDLTFLCFPVEHPEHFDAVLMDSDDRVLEIRVKKPSPGTNWVWGAFQMPGSVFRKLYELWIERERKDEYFGTLVNAYLARGGSARGVRAGRAYVDVGTLHGYREAIQVLTHQAGPGQLSA